MGLIRLTYDQLALEELEHARLQQALDIQHSVILFSAI